MNRTIDEKLKKAVAPICRRIYLRHFCKSLLFAVIAVLAQALVWQGFSFFVPIVHLGRNAAIIGGLIFVAALFIGWLMRPSMLEIAREGDRCGLQERLMTAYELIGRDDVFARLQKEDTLKKLESFEPKSIPITVPKKWSVTAALLAVLLTVVLVLPNPQDAAVEQIVRVQKEIDKQLAELEEKVEEELGKDAELTEAEKQELMKLLREMSKKLRQSKDYREALKEISRAEEKLAKMMEEAQKDRLAALGEQLGKQELTKALGDRLKQMDTRGIQEEIERLKELGRQDDMNKAIMEALQKALEEAAKELPDNFLKNQLQSMANALASAQGEGIRLSEAQLDQLAGMLTELAEGMNGNSGQMEHMLRQLKNQIARAAGEGSSQLVQNDGLSNGQGNQTGSGQGEGNGEQNGNGNGSGAGEGSGEGNGGSGNNGSGRGGGSGVGEGHTNEDAGYQEGGSSQGSGTNKPGDPDSYAEYERIYDPTRLGDGGDISQVGGSHNEEGESQQVDAGQGLGSFDGFIPYKEVFGEYRSQAMDSLDRREIPPSMREWVKDYFSSLE